MGLFTVSRQQILIFSIIYFSYVVCLIVKRNSSFWIKDVIDSDYLTKTQAGLLGFSWETLNGIAKVGGGFLVDIISPTYLLSASLAVQGFTVLSFFLPGKTYWYFSVSLWGMNGFSQAFAWPALTRVFLAWFPDVKQRGSWYGILATCQNIGAAIAPIVTAYFVFRNGWTVRLYVPGTLAILYAFVCLLTLKDVPSNNDVLMINEKNKSTLSTDSSKAVQSTVPKKTEQLRQRRSPEPTGTSGSSTGTVVSTGSTVKGASSSTTSVSTASLSTMIYLVLSSSTLWILGINYFFNSMMRSGITASFRPFLEGKANLNGGLDFAADSGAAELANVSYEIGGAIGALLGGYLSDNYFNGRRGPVMAIFGFVTIPFLIILSHSSTFLLSTLDNGNSFLSFLDNILLMFTPPSSSSSTTTTSIASVVYIKIGILYSILGICTFPPHVLNGLVSRELAHPMVLSTAGGFTKAIGQLGSAIIEMYLLRLADWYSWSSIYWYLGICSLLSGLTILPLWYTVPVTKPPTPPSNNSTPNTIGVTK